MLKSVKNPLVKDLCWLVEGHYIEQDFDLKPHWLPDLEVKLLALEHDPTPIIDAMSACKSHFLGSYFETLFSFAIEHLSDLTICLEHVQIEKEGRTLGEVDMLVETPHGELHQFEIAIKFYLERPDLYPNHWIGPNKNDSLLKKVSRAKEHQLQILQTPEGKEVIDNVANGRIPHANLMIFGRLYSVLACIESINDWLENSERGGWIRASDLPLLMPYFSYFLILQKPHWMASPNLNDNFSFISPQSAYNLVGHFLRDDRPRHVFLCRTLDDINTTKRTVFIVPDSW
ncbi:DUF1853 family protein [Marinomonas profundimaris]|uniref:DUF1853 domain-containing protein n=1 Tax=Marinomonas profundimaris TaxID=1208321 RepID=W1RYN9_9GAMM|nr:DUF1853 family protein [Marinomonas profundimaris]ETI61930.1 hypothetical protein D104_03330 [Marinomonas profundimaris]